LKFLFRVVYLLLCVGGFTSPALADRIPFLVPIKTIYPGQVIVATSVGEKLFYIKREAAPLYVSKIEQILGKVARRTLVAGKPIVLSSIVEPVKIERGQSVQMIFSSGALTISSIGVALQAAGIGDVIRLRNVDSGVIVSGRVHEDGHVEIGAP